MLQAQVSKNMGEPAEKKEIKEGKPATKV